MLVDPTSGDRSLAGCTRAARPNEYRNGTHERCAFCPGNEHLTPPEIERRGSHQTWLARAFRNKYPAIEPPLGAHEVIVDGPLHDAEITYAGTGLWRQRYRAAHADFPRGFPVLFKNSGADAGATIVHPHTQLIVVPQRPTRFDAIADAGTAYLRNHGACLWCDEAARADTEGVLVARTATAQAYVRTGSRFSEALTIVPVACETSLHRSPESQWDGVVRALSLAIDGLLRHDGERPAFNVLVHSDPHAAAQTVHWHVELVVRRSTLAGFELATGMFIREGTAKESAEQWRRMIAPPDGPI